MHNGGFLKGIRRRSAQQNSNLSTSVHANILHLKQFIVDRLLPTAKVTTPHFAWIRSRSFDPPPHAQVEESVARSPGRLAARNGCH